MLLAASCVAIAHLKAAILSASPSPIEFVRGAVRVAPLSFYFLIYLVFNGVWTTGLLVVQAYQISVNLTTNEFNVYHRLEYLHDVDNPRRFRNPFDRGCVHNWMHFCCPASAPKRAWTPLGSRPIHTAASSDFFV